MKLSTILYLAFIGLVMIVAIKVVNSATYQVNISVSNDTYLSSYGPDANFGTANPLLVQGVSRFKHPYFWFNMTSGPDKLPASATIINATLWFQMYAAAAARWIHIDNYYVSGWSLRNDSERNMTWRSQIGMAINSTYESRVNTSAVGWYQWNATKMVNLSYLRGDATMRILMNASLGNGTSTTINQQWYSDDSGGQNTYLNIWYNTTEAPAGAIECACAYGVNCHLNFTGDCHNTSVMDLGGADLYLECNGAFYNENSGQLLNVGNIYPQDTCDWYVQAGVNITVM